MSLLCLSSLCAIAFVVSLTALVYLSPTCLVSGCLCLSSCGCLCVRMCASVFVWLVPCSLPAGLFASRFACRFCVCLLCFSLLLACIVLVYLTFVCLVSVACACPAVSACVCGLFRFQWLLTSLLLCLSALLAVALVADSHCSGVLVTCMSYVFDLCLCSCACLSVPVYAFVFLF